MSQKRYLQSLVVLIFCQVYLWTAGANAKCNFTIDEETKAQEIVGQLPQLSSDQEKYEEMVQNNYFNVDNKGRIELKSQIDREKICGKMELHSDYPDCFITLTIFKTKKKGGVPSLMTMNVCIVDINDNPPILPATDDKEILENVKIGHKIPLKSATDADGPSHSVKSYSLTCDHDSPKTFDVDFNQRENLVDLIVLRGLNHESRSDYECNLEASDGEHSTQGRLHIKVTDVNDHSPQWSTAMGNFSVEIREDTSPYQAIFHLKATDGDSDHGAITYRISDQASELVQKVFSVTYSGIVQTKMRLDYEDKKAPRVYKIPVIAADNGVPPLSATATLTVSLTDENDNHPIIKLKTNDAIRITENSPPGFHLLLTVSDADSGVNGEVACSLANHLDAFKLIKYESQDIYALHSTVSFDREMADSFHLTITCEDKGQPKRKQSIDINVHIFDENDNSPRFSQRHYQVFVNEETEPRDPLFRPVVHDADKNPRLKFSLQPPGASKFVSIDPNKGDIFPVRKYDREKQANYSFQIFVTDGLVNHTDSVNVTLTILDINDHRPKFQQSYSFSVKENKPTDTIVGQVMAEDSDNGMNGTVSYSLADYSVSHLFKVSNNGTIRLVRPLDRETKDNYYIAIKAFDHGFPVAQTATTTVLVNVDDDNDSAPRFPKSAYMRNSPCNQHLLITDIRATDADIDPNNQIKYKLVRVLPNVTSPVFRVDPNNGEIMMPDSKENCKDITMSYRLYIQAYDPNKEEFNHNISVTINLLRGYGTNNNVYGSDNKYWDNNKRQSKDGNYSHLISDTNLLIVVVLVCVSVLLAVLMLALIIYLKRRQDREAQYEKGNSSPDVEEAPSAFSTYQKRNESQYMTAFCTMSQDDVCLQDARGTLDRRNKSLDTMEKNNLRAVHSMDNLYMTESMPKKINQSGTLERSNNNPESEDLYHDYQAMIPNNQNAYYESAKPYAYSIDQPYTEFHSTKLQHLLDKSRSSPVKNQNNQVVSFDLSSTMKDDSNGKQKKTFGTLNRSEKGPYFTISFV